MFSQISNEKFVRTVKRQCPVRMLFGMLHILFQDMKYYQPSTLSQKERELENLMRL